MQDNKSTGVDGIPPKLCGGIIGVQERKKTMQIIKRHLMQLQLKSDNLKEAMSKN